MTPTQRPASTSDARKRLAENAPAEPDADERHHLAELVWNVSRRDEGTISATGANIVAGAILAAGYSRTPGAYLAAAKAEGAVLAEVLRESLGRAESLDILRAMLLDAADRLSDPQHQGNQHAWPEHAEMLRTLAARLREQGGDQ